MKTIRYFATLFYYDGVQIFEARDIIGGHYIAVMIESVDDRDRYILVGAEPEKLRQFRTGELDLLSLLVDGAEESWFIAKPQNDFNLPLILEIQSSPLKDHPDFLPESGFVLHDIPANTDTILEARTRNNLVLEFAVEPPEAAEKHQIHASTLAGLLLHLQTLVKHAHNTALRDMPVGSRRNHNVVDACFFNIVIPAAPGSFRVVLEAASAPDVFGVSTLSLALERIDCFFEHVNEPKQTLEIVKAHKGHLAGAYLRLLRFLVDNNTYLSYSWAEPRFQNPKHYSVTKTQAVSLVEYLSGVSNIGAETVILQGVLDKADRGNGTWRIITEETGVSGKIKQDGPSLAGLKIGNRYSFTCLEEIEETQGGREQRSLFLMEHEPI